MLHGLSEVKIDIKTLHRPFHGMNEKNGKRISNYYSKLII